MHLFYPINLICNFGQIRQIGQTSRIREVINEVRDIKFFRFDKFFI